MKHLATAVLLAAGMFFSPTTSSAQWVMTSGPAGGGAIRALVTNGTTLFAGAENVGISLSTNNGTNWTAVNSGLPTNPAIACLTVVGTNLYAGIATQGIYVSTNSGTTWTASNTGLTNMFVRAIVAKGTNLFAATYGGVFVSTNGGANWSAVNSGLTTTIVFSLAVSGSNLLAGTDGGGVFLSSNNGTSWTASNTGFPSPATTSVWCFLVDGSNVYAGYGRGVALSTNNGASWTTVNTGFPNATINIMSLLSTGGNLFAAASGTGVYRSTNNGANWATYNTGLANLTMLSLAAIGSNIFAGTFGSNVWRQQLPTSVGEAEGVAPHAFLLEQNYPNPFNPSTTIRYYLPAPVAARGQAGVQSTNHVTLKVYDMLGREVATLVDEVQDAGASAISAGPFKSVEFDASALASGTYLYRLEAGGFVATKKLVVLR